MQTMRTRAQGQDHQAAGRVAPATGPAPEAGHATLAVAPATAPARGRVWSGIAQVALKLAYPALILGAWHWDAPRYIGCMLFVLLWLQRWIGKGSVATSLRRLTAIDWCVAGVLSVVSAAIVATNSEMLLRLYPSLVNLGLLVAFGATLVRGPSMIEKFARLRTPALSEHAVHHTRRVTQIWCGFFVLNGAFSAYTGLYWARDAWSLYNGAISYGLIGLLLVGEIAWRYLVVLPRAARSEIA
ncbi:MULTISPECIES: hypothetical protein [Paraburkholderia]|uniref:COG4648 family protein n=1 Tax=Paraburkholderia TaxID=1822464 RepID=UPI00224CAB4F|nr:MULTISPECIES: hypothetical protein [Paraburkholderia]MCX4160849.1 hypothetical protein [Paraburkholderia megapolitana]MDN7156346.1 hypothetical protein [Paraburkholderia sp. CHISQ3]MDQ6493391.1 hypothetical protein [Paraburkholderia megapolitana]